MFENGLDILGRAIPKLLVPSNATAVNQFLDSLLKKYSQYALQETVKKASVVGAGVLALGVIGGIAGALLTKFK